MAPRLLGDIKTVDIISRYRPLAVALNCLLDSSVLPNALSLGAPAGSPQIINRGEVLAAYVPNDASVHVGKYRPYAEGTVTTAFATNSVNFAIAPYNVNSPGTRPAQWFVPGDVVTDSLGNALGTIATFNATTGVGTLTANSSNVLAIGGIMILAAANWSLGSKLGIILEDEELVEQGSDQPTSAYREGFFNVSLTSLTPAAVAALSASYMEGPGVVASASNEVRIQ